MLSVPETGPKSGIKPVGVNRSSAARLWTAFWQEFCPENVPHERCHIPGDGRYAVDRHWALFADALPRGANVIDLGCGAGIVGRLLLARRPDLHVCGVDFADVPTPAVENLVFHPWTSMEDLPLGLGRFDAALSLFGIEYGNIDKTAVELARVLKPGARFSFLIHHSESEIVAEGGNRRRALQDLLSGRVKAVFQSGHVGGVKQQTERLKARFPGEPSIKLFTNYLRHHVQRNPSERRQMWQHLLDGLGPEIALLTQMERSAKSPAQIGSWIAPLLPIMRIVSVSVIRRSSGDPIAWQVSGIR